MIVCIVHNGLHYITSRYSFFTAMQLIDPSLRRCSSLIVCERLELGSIVYQYEVETWLPNQQGVFKFRGVLQLCKCTANKMGWGSLPLGEILSKCKMGCMGHLGEICQGFCRSAHKLVTHTFSFCTLCRTGLLFMC